MIKYIKYLVDAAGNKEAVVIDLRKNRQLWEDFYDGVIAKSRANEPTVSLETVKAQLKKRKK